MPRNDYHSHFPKKFTQHARADDEYKKRINNYKTPAGFMSWQDLLTHFIGTNQVMDRALMAKDQSETSFIDQNTNLTLWHHNFALHNNAPLRFLSKSVCESYLRTKLSNLPFVPKEPLPCMILCFPKGVLVDDDGFNCFYAVVAPTNKICAHMDKWMRRTEAIFERMGLVESARGSEQFSLLERKHGPVTAEMIRRTNPLTAWNIPAFEYDGINISYNNGWSSYSFGHSWDNLEASGSLESEDPDAASFMQNLAKLCVNAYYTLSYKEELVSEEESSIGLGFDRSKNTKRYSNVWIGKDYVPKSSRKKSDSQEPSGKISPHWRSGHWHTVLSGHGRKERELRWFDPVYVNPQ